MLTLGATLADALARPEPQLVWHIEFLVALTAGGKATRTVKLIKSPYGPLADADGDLCPNIVVGVGSAALSLDPIDRTGQIGAMSFDVLDDGYIREVVTDGYIGGQKVTFTLGTVDSSPSDWQLIWTGLIRDYQITGGMFRFSCDTLDVIAQDGPQLAGLWAHKHPAELALDILKWAGVPEADIDTDTFAYDANLNISHFIARYHGVNWDGGNTRSVTLYGDAVGNTQNWSISGCNVYNTDQGKLYIEIACTASIQGWIRLRLYKSTSGGNENLVAYGEARGFALAMTGTYIQIGFSDTDNGIYTGIQSGIRGTVELYYDGASYSVAVDSSDYILVDSSEHGKEIKAWDAAQQLASMCMAGILQREAGKLEWRYFEPSNSSVANLTDDDLIGEIETEAMSANLINQVMIRWGVHVPYYKIFPSTAHLVLKRATSQLNHGIVPGTTACVKEKQIDLAFMDACGVLADDIADNTVDLIEVYRTDYDNGRFGKNYGFCCTGDGTSGGAQADNRLAKSGEGRYAYLRMGADEIIKFNSSQITEDDSYITIWDPQTETLVNKYSTFHLYYSGGTRAQFGTTAAAAKKNTRVYDVTIPVYLGNAILDRCEEGCQTLSFATSYKWLALQVCDFITLTNSLYCSTGLDGLTSSTKWEIISKELSESTIKWRVARVGPDSNTATTRKPFEPRPINVGLPYQDYSRLEENKLVFNDGGSITSTTSGWDTARNAQTFEDEEGGDDIYWSGRVRGGNIDTASQLGMTVANNQFGHASRGETVEPDNWEIGASGTWGTTATRSSSSLTGSSAVAITATTQIKTKLR